MKEIKDYVAIDFEAATQQRNSACSVGIITFENYQLKEIYYTKIKPPNNKYNWHCTKIHGMTAKSTRHSKPITFHSIEILNRLKNKTIVAHNAPYDKSVLLKSMEFIGILPLEHQISDQWQCTMKLAKQLGHTKTKLSILTDKYGIELDHHDAKSDAIAAGKLFAIFNQKLKD